MNRMRYLLGVVTLVVMAVSGYFLFRLLEPKDPADQFRLEVSFLDARGLKPGADVKYRGLRVGSVRTIDVGNVEDRAIVTLVFDEGRGRHAREDATFWIVTPRFHGISTGVTGLDTLVRDAYVAFGVPPGITEGTPLASGSRVVGAESPEAKPLPPLRRGDLSMRVLIPENHGVARGAKVMFRGMPTGEVRAIELAPSGSHVVVTVRIASEHRATVTDGSVFWVAQPGLNLQWSFTNPVSVNELGSLLSPHIAYYTDPKQGVPVPDGYVVAAAMKRPSLEVSEVPKKALTRKMPTKKLKNAGPLVLVRVIYAAEDVDWLSPNDSLHREGTGILYLDTNNQPRVLTARSVCDAAYYHKETLGWTEIQHERIRVQLSTGQALTATRIWVPQDKDGKEDKTDIALLRVVGLPHNYPTSKGDIFTFGEQVVSNAPQTLHVCGEAGQVEEPQSFDPTQAIDLDRVRGGMVLRDGKLLGFVGQSDDATKAKLIFLKALPESSRPKR